MGARICWKFIFNYYSRLFLEYDHHLKLLIIPWYCFLRCRHFNGLNATQVSDLILTFWETTINQNVIFLKQKKFIWKMDNKVTEAGKNNIAIVSLSTNKTWQIYQPGEKFSKSKNGGVVSSKYMPRLLLMMFVPVPEAEETADETTGRPAAGFEFFS